MHNKPYGKANAYHTCGKGEPGRSDVKSLRIHCFNGSSSKPAPMITYNFTTDKRSIFGIIVLNTWCVHSPHRLTDGLSAICIAKLHKIDSVARILWALTSCWRSLHPQQWPSSDEKTSRDVITSTFVFVLSREHRSTIESPMRACQSTMKVGYILILKCIS